MQVSFGAKTDVGRERQRNEDNFLVDKRLQLYIVCDGMGGHAGGDVASSTAVGAIRTEIAGHMELLKLYERDRGPNDRLEILKVIEQAIQRASQKIFERGMRNPAERGMGTTASLLLLCGGRAFIGHVGDSRVYLHRRGKVHQLSDDHSLLAEMVKSGRVRSADEVDPRFRNAVTRAVGVHETVEVDTLDLAVLPDDRFLLCSDGLTGYTTSAHLRELITASDDEERVCQAMIHFANNRGGADNITAVVMTVRAIDTDAAELAHEVQVLRNLTLFRYLSYSELLRVLNIAETKFVSQGDAVFRSGEAGRSCYIILRGTVQVRSANVVVAVLEEGRHFGEMALVDSEPRAADAIAVEDARLLAIPRSAFHELMRRNPHFAVKMLWSFIKALTGRLRFTTGELSLVKSAFFARSPEEADKMGAAWLPADELEVEPSGPRTDVMREIEPPPDEPVAPAGPPRAVSAPPPPPQGPPRAASAPPGPARAVSVPPPVPSDAKKPGDPEPFP